MTDWDAPLDTAERASGFLACISAAVWLWSIPARVVAGLTHRTRRDALDEDADPTGAIEMGNYLHYGEVSK